MVDNTTLNTGTGGDVIGSDDIGGVKFQRVKLIHGADGVNDGDVGTSNGLPIQRRDATASGTIAAISTSVSIALNGQSGVALQITGTWVGTLQFEGTVDGTNWVVVNGVFAGSSTPGPTTTANGIVRATPSGLAQFRVTATAWTSGTATITLRASAASGGTFLNQSLTAGTNSIGSVVAGGNVAGGATDSGNPVKIGGLVNTGTPAALTTGQRGDWWMDARGAGAVTLASGGVFNEFANPGDAAANAFSFVVQTRNTFYNGTSWDRMRGTIANGISVDVTRLPSTTLAVTATAAANTAATVTLPAVAGQFHYITGIEIMRTSTAALAGTATLVVTTTNLPGSLAWSFGNAMAAGATQRDVSITFPNPIKSSTVNTATTVVMPAPGAAVLWRATIYYYTAA